MECRQALKVRDLVLTASAGSRSGTGVSRFPPRVVRAPGRSGRNRIRVGPARDDDGADLVPSTRIRRAPLGRARGRRPRKSHPVPRASGDGRALEGAAAAACGGWVPRGSKRGSPAPPRGHRCAPDAERARRERGTHENRTVDASRAVLDLSSKPRRERDVPRRGGPREDRAFLVTTRGSSGTREKDVADLLVSLMSGAAEAEGAGAGSSTSCRPRREGATVSPRDRESAPAHARGGRPRA